MKPLKSGANVSNGVLRKMDLYKQIQKKEPSHKSTKNIWSWEYRSIKPTTPISILLNQNSPNVCPLVF